MRKVLIGLFAAIILVVVVAVAYIYVFGADRLRQAIETYGSRATQAEVRLRDLELDLISGKVALRGFSQGNPPGFDSGSAIRFGEVTIEVDPSTVDKDIIVVRRVLIAEPQVTYEFGRGSSNLQAIQRNVTEYLGMTGGAGKSSSDDDGKRLIIEDLRIVSGRVEVAATGMRGQQLGATLPDIQLRDIGKEGGKPHGATPAEVIEKVVGVLNQQAQRVVSGMDLSSLLAGASPDVQGAIQNVTGRLPAIPSVGATGDGSSERLDEGIRSLFGR